MGSPLRTVVRNRQFLWFLASWSTASAGYSVFAISIVWLAYVVSHSFLVVGGVLAVERGAYCVTFAVAPIADRVRNQRTIFVASYPVQAAAAVALGFGALTGRLTVPEMVALVVVLSFLWDLSWAAANAAPGILLSANEQFAAAGVEGILGGVNSIAGFAAGGALIFLVGAGGGLYLYAGLLVVATALAVPLRITAVRGSPDGSFRASFRRGWATLVGGVGRPLLQLGVVDAVEGFLSVAPIVLLALVAVRTFSGSATDYAVLFVAYVVGGAVAGLAFARWNPRQRVGGIVVASLLVTAAAFLAAALEPPVLALATSVWFAIGFLLSAYQTAKYAFLRGSVPPDQLARVTSNLYVFPGVASAAGALVLGAVATGLAPGPLAIWVAVGFAAGGVGAFALPGVRRLSF